MISNDSSSTEFLEKVRDAAAMHTGSEAYTNPLPNAGARTLGFMSIQRLLTRHRMWPTAAVILYMIMYYPVATVLLISSSNHYARISQISAEAALSDRLSTVSSWLGLRQSFTFMAIIFGAVLAIQGFSWLFSNEKTDFYNCQPFTAKQRFTYVFANGILIYTIPLVISTALALLIASAMDALTGMILTESLIGMVRLIVLFLSGYCFAILAVMQAGRGIYAAIMTFIMICSESLVYIMYQAYAGTFLRTWYYMSFDRWPSLTPLYAIGLPQWTLNQQSGWYYSIPTPYILRGILADMIPADLTSLAVGGLCLTGALVLYRRRHAEYAGSSVLFRPARVIFLLWTAVYTALTGGIIVQQIFTTGAESGRPVSPVPVVCAGITAVITAAVVQGVYDRDLRRCFAHIWQHIASVVGAVAIFLIFCLDLTGYDRYVPDVSQVSDAALYASTEQGFSYPGRDADGEIRFNIYGSNHILREMKLTGAELDALLRIAGRGMECQRSNEYEPYGNGWDAVVSYRLKSGKTVMRSIRIPYDIDAADMDAVIGSDTYRQTLFPIYSDAAAEKMSDRSARISFWRGGSSKTVSGELYAAFAAAYKADLESYSFSQASNECSIGRVETYSMNYTFDETYEVYPSFTRTIELLKSSGLYIDDFTADSIDEITVYKTDPEDDYSSWAAHFTDKEQIGEILAHCERKACTVWKRYTAQMSNYSVDLTPAGRKNTTITEYNFREGEIPQFVEDAMQPADEEVTAREYGL